MCKRYRMKWRKTRESYVDEVFNFLVFFILLHSFICMCRNKTKCEKVQISPGRACYTTVPITHNTYTNTSSQKSALVFFFFFFFFVVVCLFVFVLFFSKRALTKTVFLLRRVVFNWQEWLRREWSSPGQKKLAFMHIRQAHPHAIKCWSTFKLQHVLR